MNAQGSLLAKVPMSICIAVGGLPGSGARITCQLSDVISSTDLRGIGCGQERKYNIHNHSGYRQCVGILRGFSGTYCTLA
jgi:hypothetical protein